MAWEELLQFKDKITDVKIGQADPDVFPFSGLSQFYFRDVPSASNGIALEGQYAGATFPYEALLLKTNGAPDEDGQLRARVRLKGQSPGFRIEFSRAYSLVIRSLDAYVTAGGGFGSLTHELDPHEWLEVFVEAFKLDGSLAYLRGKLWQSGSSEPLGYSWDIEGSTFETGNKEIFLAAISDNTTGSSALATDGFELDWVTWSVGGDPAPIPPLGLNPPTNLTPTRDTSIIWTAGRP